MKEIQQLKIIFRLYFALLSLLKDTMTSLEAHPFTFRKITQGSFDQSDARFGETAGSQCMCNAFFSVCFSAIKKARFWTTWELDYILNNGNSLYSRLGHTSDFLSIDDLPTSVNIHGYPVSARKVLEDCGRVNSDFIVDVYQRNGGNVGNGMIVIIKGYSFSIIWSDTAIFLFDSHSRDSNAIPSSNGTSILLQFDTMHNVQQYLTRMYGHQETELFQVVYLQIDISSQFAQNLIKDLTRVKEREQRQRRRSDLSSSTNIHNREKDRMQKQNACNKLEEKENIVLKEEAKKYMKRKRDSRSAAEQEKIRQAERERLQKKRARILESDKKIVNSKRRDIYKHIRANQSKELKDKKRSKDCIRLKLKRSESSALASNNLSLTNRKSIESIKIFKSQIRKGPFFVCVICNRTFYERSVKYFDDSKYEVDSYFFAYRVESYDGNEYICQTCHSKLNKGKTPCQAVTNGLQLFSFPKELQNLRKLEKIIIAKRLLFKKVAIMPKGQSLKIRGAICNVPIEADDVCNILPRGMDNNGVVQVALKRKLSFKSNVYFEPVRPQIIHITLSYLKENNPLYSDINIDMKKIPSGWINTVSPDDTDSEKSDDPKITFIDDSVPAKILPFHDIDFSCEFVQPEVEDEENPLDKCRLGSGETAYVPDLAYVITDDATISIAPGENKTPIPIICDENCEVLAHPTLFPKGSFGYTVQRETKLSPSKYFNQRLLNYTQRFAADSDYIFFAQSVLQHLNLNGSINIAMKKIKADGLTAGTLSQDFKERIKSFVANDEAYNFMNTVKGTPAYWKRFLFEVLAMVKQLGLPTYFMTLSCADLR